MKTDFGGSIYSIFPGEIVVFVCRTVHPSPQQNEQPRHAPRNAVAKQTGETTHASIMVVCVLCSTFHFLEMHKNDLCFF